MTRDQMIRLAEAYFAALDAMDVEALHALLTEDCVLTIETHGIAHEGRAAIVELFASRWEKPTVTATHTGFAHVADAQTGRIASTFTARYSGPDAPEPKSNANVFTLRDGRIAGIMVYMAGANTVRG